jgi:hypothetical protein
VWVLFLTTEWLRRQSDDVSFSRWGSFSGIRSNTTETWWAGLLASLGFGLEAVLCEKCQKDNGNLVGGALGFIGLWLVYGWGV